MNDPSNYRSINSADGKEKEKPWKTLRHKMKLPMHMFYKKEVMREKQGKRKETFSAESTGGKQVKGFAKDLKIIWELIWDKKFLNIILFAIPLALASHANGWGDIWVFSLNFLVMIPMASLLGDFTEEAASVVGETFGGLLNATFGNAVEVVVSIQALRSGQVRVVQAMLMGSVLSNLLLVLGSSFLFGGIKRHQLYFNSTAAQANCCLLLLSALALVVPTPLGSYEDIDDEDVLLVSRITALFLFFIYFQLLLFQLVTHKDYFAEPSSQDEEQGGRGIESGDSIMSHDFTKDDDEEEEEEHNLSLISSLLGLGIMTLLVSFFSDLLVDSITGFTEAANLSDTFVGLILLPIVGNVVEHLTAVTMAIKNKMEISMGIAVGSGTQVSVFVIPTVTLFGWILDVPMNLNFPTFEISIYILSVVSVAILISSGTSNWLFGSMLVTMYLLLAVSVYFVKSEDL